MTVLTQATNEWSSRPADQRFSSLADLLAATSHHRASAVESDGVILNTLKVVGVEPKSMSIDGSSAAVPMLASASGQIAKFTHWSFGQLCKRIGAPAAYLRELPTDLVATNMNYGLANAEPRENAEGDSMLFSQNGSLTLRATLSPVYRRIWNADVVQRVIALTEREPAWQPAPAAFDGSRGLYASDKDRFVFLVDNDRRIFETLPGGGLGRGFFVKNSELGDGSFRITTFFYEYICGNHRVWGASGVQELRIPHVGNADAKAFGRLAVELRKYADSSVREDEAKIERMRTYSLGATPLEVIDAVFKLGTSRRVAAQALAIAEKNEDSYGNPRSVWGFTGGLTEVARDLPNADARADLEAQAGKIMKIAF
jgi:hypothetical protein